MTEQNRAAARSYGKAAFEVATEKHELGDWQRDLERLAAIFTDPDVAGAFENPRLDDGKRIGIALGLVPDDLGQDRSNFVKLLVLAHRTDLLPVIREEFEALVAEAEGRTELEVTLASEVTAKGRARLTQLLGQKLGRDVELKVRVDPSILGGVILRQGDRVADGSVRRRLTEMREELLAS
ncbi:MAG: F0F1 ATP synthase subunit delta [Candidatus Dormibacteraeota bacterium]|nr:F0F1 ATP synthase subunit delta [Candidatus Dormibacteraeota bacterium]